MNRKDLQQLANLRLREAQALYRARQYSGAYYLAGYAVECALKACIAKNSKRHDFPDKKRVIESYTHDLEKLALLANLEESRLLLAQEDPIFQDNWASIVRWSEESRYRIIEKQACNEFLNAIMERHHGLMPWIKQLW
ncbi:HEPN domain-containing protein [Silvibacterium bohemicum]|uniref:HEPN domain-containing protein n=1 Tax=Silvibacterium bohemicum TaxID=1577686 RepID=A0A841JY19_9BACT|nr:HEPN domain-containing protein [Silvibacterium bohemicum]MBB6146333.1 HEPN domain-containing protein [Silvibacterium bohemicum]